MTTFKLNNGEEIPGFGLGTWKSDPGIVGEAVKHAIKIGYRHIDCAATYGNEDEIGEAFKECFDEGIVKREDLFITSKLWNDSHAPEDVKSALKKTLKDLGVDYVDLYHMHFPVVFVKDAPPPPEMKEEHFIPLEKLPVSVTWKAMEECVDEGLTKSIGVSNFSIPKLEELLKTARIPPAVLQVERHPYLQQMNVREFCEKNNIHETAYSPLGSKDRDDSMKQEDEPDLFDDEVLKEVAEKHGVTAAQVMIRWAMESGTSVIPKSTNEGRLAENFEVYHGEKFKLDDEDMKKIAKIDKHIRYVDASFFCTQPGSPYTLENIWDE